MRKASFAVFAILLVFALSSLALGGSKGKMDLKVGDEVYVCNCGEKCPFNTMSMSPGKCTCGMDMVKAQVIKVEEGKATVKAEGWEKERVFRTIGKYACDCSPGCKYGTISQNPGKCTCGADMKKMLTAIPTVRLAN